MAPTPITCAIVDDHELMRFALTAALEADPAVELVGVAKDGEELMEVVARRPPDVVIADAHMPRLDGVGVCALMAERFPEVRVILYTGDEDPALLEAALEAGARGFLLKAGSLEELSRSLHVVMDGHLYVDRAMVAGLRRAGPADCQRADRPRDLGGAAGT